MFFLLTTEMPFQAYCVSLEIQAVISGSEVEANSDDCGAGASLNIKMNGKHVPFCTVQPPCCTVQPPCCTVQPPCLHFSNV